MEVIMNYYKVLTNIFLKTNKLILSDEYKTDYTNINSFIRDRKLSFTNCMHFILSSSKKSLASVMAGFIENYKKYSSQIFQSKLSQKHVEILIQRLLKNFTIW